MSYERIFTGIRNVDIVDANRFIIMFYGCISLSDPNKIAYKSIYIRLTSDSGRLYYSDMEYLTLYLKGDLFEVVDYYEWFGKNEVLFSGMIVWFILKIKLIKWNCYRNWEDLPEKISELILGLSFVKIKIGNEFKLSDMVECISGYG